MAFASVFAGEAHTEKLRSDITAKRPGLIALRGGGEGVVAQAVMEQAEYIEGNA
ncbi:MAG: hypothetical protein ACREMQ_11215 [Longimicrobiales bacterium]